MRKAKGEEWTIDNPGKEGFDLQTFGSESGELTSPGPQALLPAQCSDHCRLPRETPRRMLLGNLGSWVPHFLWLLSALVSSLCFEKHSSSNPWRRERMDCKVCVFQKSSFQVALKSFWICQNGPNTQALALASSKPSVVPFLHWGLWQATYTNLRTGRAVAMYS